MTRSNQHQTPTAIRDETFQRRFLGLDTDAVYEYLDLLADQVQATEQELAESRAENERLRTQLQSAQAELDEYEDVGERVNDQVVELFSQAQLVAEQMVQDVSLDARERIGHARAHEQRIVEEARNEAGQQVSSYARSAQARMQSIVDSFASEVDRLEGPQPPREQGSTSSSDRADRPDPLSDDWGEWQTRPRNGSGPWSNGSR